jgi:hypothetical protein
MERLGLVLCVIFAAGVAACGSKSSAPSSPRTTQATGPIPNGTFVASTPSRRIVRQFTGVPMPADNALDLDRTVVIGDDSDWLGRIILSVPASSSDMVDFYRREMPRYGWMELAVTRSITSVLTFQMNNRIATAQIAAGPQGSGSAIELWVNPRPSRDMQTATPGSLYDGTAALPADTVAPLSNGGPSFQGVRRRTTLTEPAPRMPVDQAPLPPAVR